ncbi:MAG: S8 family peptidase [Oleiphilaceae bacterium]|nr:S8 family peptidase [Oleiphilaceae bacterium]
MNDRRFHPFHPNHPSAPLQRRLGLVAPALLVLALASTPAQAGFMDRLRDIVSTVIPPQEPATETQPQDGDSPDGSDTSGDNATDFTRGSSLTVGDAIPGRYILTLDPDIEKLLGVGGLDESIQTLLGAVGGGDLLHTYRSALKGFAVRLTDSQARILGSLPGVRALEKDRVVALNNTLTQHPSPWGLDRTDQRFLPLNNRYHYPEQGGEGVTLYILDSGLFASHSELAGRVLPGRNFAGNDTGLLGLPGSFKLFRNLFNPDGPDSADTSDCHGHGTHVASSAAGRRYGIAKAARVVPVRVMDCFGAGSNADVIAGVDWVAANHQAPAVANLSLGGGPSQALDTAVVNAVNQGVTFVVAAGNSDRDACSGSPSRIPEVLTVGSTTLEDERSSFSNHGPCVDIFAPGSDIAGAWLNSEDETRTLSGTSMAAPHVAGAAAMILGEFPDLDPPAVMSLLLENATRNVLTELPPGSPSRLLHVPSGVTLQVAGSGG